MVLSAGETVDKETTQGGPVKEPAGKLQLSRYGVRLLPDIHLIENVLAERINFIPGHRVAYRLKDC